MDAWLERALPEAHVAPGRVHAAMRYALLGGGKRLRPLLALAAGDALGARRSKLLPIAACIELLHAASLVRDDLPAMDDDDERRGRPSCHRAFDEATAMLAADALIVLAFELIAAQAHVIGFAAATALVTAFARAVGSHVGLVGGQARDLFPGETPTAADIEATHAGKTGALFGLALESAAIVAGADGARANLRTAGVELGVAFQIEDDLRDRRAPRAALGRTPGSDDRAGRASYPRVVGDMAAAARVAELLDSARLSLASVLGDASPVERLIARLEAA